MERQPRQDNLFEELGPIPGTPEWEEFKKKLSASNDEEQRRVKELRKKKKRLE